MASLLRILLTFAVAAACTHGALADQKSPRRLFRWPAARRPEVKQPQTPALPGHPTAAVDARAQYHYDPSDRERLNEYYRQMYPKYYWGFHARTLQDYGYAPGDIGFRGGLSYPGQPW
jgi:hypothetical protein